MGVMAKMRNSTPVILWILIFSFGILWVLQDTQVFDSMAGGPTTMGSVNGENISIEEYNNRVNYYVEQFNQRSDTPMSAEMRSNLEEQAWEDLIAERLIDQKMNEMGIGVTDDELVNMVTGENPDPFIREQFADEEGRIDRVALQAAIEAPENQQIWLMIEQQLRQNRQQEKLGNFISSALQVSRRDIESAYIRDNSFADVRYIRIPYNEVGDEEISVSEDEIRRYYEENRDRFHRNETYRFQYVAFDKTPTAEDTSRTIQDLESLRSRFAETESHADFLQQNESLVPYRDSFVPAEEIREDYQPVLSLDTGEVSEVHMINGNPHIFKKVDQNEDGVKFAVLAYRVEADPVATLDRLSNEADEFSYFAQEDGFEAEAEAQNYDVQSASATQDVPFVPGLGQASLLVNELERLQGGQISDVIELSQAFVVVRMTQVIPEGPRPLSEVRSQIENELRDRARTGVTVANARELIQAGESLDEIAAAGGREVQTAANIRFGGTSISGAGREPAIIGAIFALEPGEQSGILEGSNAAFILEVEELTLADPAQMTEEEELTLRQGLEQQKGMAFNAVWVDQLKENARIRDNRSRMISARGGF